MVKIQRKHSTTKPISSVESSSYAVKTKYSQDSVWIAGERRSSIDNTLNDVKGDVGMIAMALLLNSKVVYTLRILSNIILFRMD